VFSLAGGGVIYSTAEAFETVCHYAFDTQTVEPTAGFRAAFAPQVVPRFAYRTYDCVAASDGPEFSDLDLLVSAGLNARIDMRAFARLRSFADRAARDLDHAHASQPDFLRLTREEVGNDPPTGSAGWYLSRAWRQGMATPGLGVARVHKTLHHKRPRLVPLLDNETSAPIGKAARAVGCGQWQLIWDEVHAHAGHFYELVDKFDKQASSVGGVSLSWLRLYDILVWMSLRR
jgi:Family of unknown function (DUF6308)